MILLSLFLNLILSQEIKTLIPGKRIQGFQAKWLNQIGDYYSITLDEKKENSDLVIMVKAINPGGDPNIFISRKNQLPSNKNESEISYCASNGNDLCIIDKSQIEINQPFYIGLICNGNCRYELRVDYDEEYLLSQNDFVQFKLNDEQETEIIQIQLNEYSKSDVELEIEVKIVNYHELQNEFQVYLNVGLIKPTSQNYDKLGLDTWSGTKLINLSVQEYPYNTNFTLLIRAQPGSVVQVRTKTFGIKREINLFEVYHGMIEQNQKRVFKLKIDNLNHFSIPEDPQKIKLYIKLTPFLGHATLYANPDFEPVLLSQYKYQFEQQSSQVLLISQWDFKLQQQLEIQEIYIAVYGNELCTFELQAGIYDFEFQFIEINVPYEGKLYNDEIINYWFSIQGNTTKKVSVSLVKYQGETNIYLKRCSFDDQCKIIQDDITDIQYSQLSENLFIYNQAVGNQMLVFDYDPSVCNSFGDFYNCIYVFAIVPVYTQTRLNDEYSYQVQVSMQSKHIYLRENTPQKSIVERLQYNYFKFIVDEKQDIQRIAFMLTPIQGKFQMFVSQQIKRPNINEFDKQSDQNIIRYGTQENEYVQKGTYYLSVYGLSAGIYTITVVIIRDNEDIRIKGKFAWQYVQLYEGSPQDYILEYGEVGLYKIDLTTYLSKDELQLKFHDNLVVEILQESGQVMMYGFDHPTANLNESRWNSTTQIILSSSEKEYPQMLYIRVQAENQNNYVQFRIVYRLGWKTTTLVLNENYFGYIQKEEYQYFAYTFFKQEDVVITKKAQSDNDSAVEVHVFIENQQYELKSGSMIISALNIPLEYCKTQSSEIFFCSIQISVYSKIDTFFSLLISKDNSQIQLSESQPLYQAIPSSYHHYYIICEAKNQVIINVVNIGYPQQLQIIVALHQAKEKIDKGNYQYLTDPKDSKVFKVSKTHIGVSHSQVTIKSNDFVTYGCVDICVLAITIQKIKDLEYHLQENQQYMIQYSSGSVFLPERFPLYGSVNKDEIKYFSAVVYTKDTNLMILLTPTSSCDVNIIVSKDKYPTEDDFDWSSKEYLGDQLVIESGNPIHPEMEGEYFIGVISDSYCPFSIVYQTGLFHYYKMEIGIPYNLILKKGEIAYFKYFHYIEEAFTILVHTNNQGLVYFVQELKSSDIDLREFESDLFDKFSYNNEGKGYKSNLIINEPQYSAYLIAVQAIQEVDFVIAVQVRFSRIYLSQNVFLMNTLEENQNQTYIYYAQVESYLKIFLQEGEIHVDYGSEAQQKLDNKIIFTRGSNLETLNANLKLPQNHNGIFIIQVIAKSKSVTYKIQCGSYEGQKIINIGENYNLVLQPQQQESFLYKGINQKDKQTFSMMITILLNEYTQLSYSKLQQHLPAIKVTYKKTNGVEQSLIPLFETQIEHNYYAEFNDLEGNYEIEIINKNQVTQSFNVIFGNSYLNILTPNQKRLSVLEKQKPKYWEFYCPSAGKLFLQIQQCESQTMLYGSSDIEALRNGQYSLQFQINNNFTEEIQINSTGQYYFSTYLIQTNSYSEKAPFLITAQLVQSNSYIPHKDIEPGWSGQLQWEVINSEDKYYLKVQGSQVKIQNLNDPDFSIVTVSYHLIFDYIKTDNEPQFNYCVDTSKYVQKVYHVEQDLQLPLELMQELDEQQLAEAQKIQFNVFSDTIVKLKNGEFVHLEQFYQPRLIDNDILETLKWKRYIKYSFLVVCIMLILSVIIMKIQKSINKKRFQFEITEQPNIEMHYRGLND